MFKTIALLLMITVPGLSQGWKRVNRRSPHYHYYYPYNNGISGGAVTTIGIGTGVVGYIIGRRVAASRQPVYVQNNSQHIECREFDIRVVIDNQNKTAKIMKCRVDGGDWKLPD
jgi:hypothetical protein